MSQRRTPGAVLVAVSAAALVALSGCTAGTKAAAHPGSSQHPSSSASHSWPVVNLKGTGQIEQDIDIPIGAKSVRVTLVCSSANFVININSSTNNSRGGSCAGTNIVTLPLPPYSHLSLSVDVLPATVPYTATVKFEAAKVKPDATITAECKKVSAADSILQNAEAGYTQKALSTADWHTMIDQASSDLKALAATATGQIGKQLPAIIAWVTGPSATPGNLLVHKPANAFDAANQVIGQVCGNNGTPIAIQAKYGG